jgi:hypothetical protein
MKSGDIATPVDTLEAEVKRLEEAQENAISQVDKQKLAKDIAYAEMKVEKAKQEAADKAKQATENVAKKAKKTTKKKHKK